MICHLHASESQGVMQSESEGWRSSRADGVSPRPWAGEDEGRCPTSTSEGKKKEKRIPPSSAFCHLQALHGLDNAHSHWGGDSTLLSSPTQRLFSSQNMPPDIQK